MLARLRAVTNELLDAQTEDERAAHRSSGSMISVYAHTFFAELVVYPTRPVSTRGFRFLGTEMGVRVHH